MLCEIPVVEQAAVVYGIALRPCAYRNPVVTMSRLRQANRFSGGTAIDTYPHENTM
jgi:hypothetical protein